MLPSNGQAPHGSALRDAGFDDMSGAGVPGPIDPEGFFDAQRRHRRAARHLAMVGAVAAFVSGVPIGIVMASLCYAMLAVVLWLLEGWLSLPDRAWVLHAHVVDVAMRVGDWIDAPDTPIPVAAVLGVVAVGLLPGMLFMLCAWAALRRAFVHGGTAGLLQVLAEQRVANVIAELAIAAGVPPPRVAVLDEGAPNAALLGSGPDDAVIVVSRSLLEVLARDQLQGVLASLAASIGNGDLSGARSILAVFETYNLAGLVLRAPVDPAARRTLWRLLQYAFGSHPPTARSQDAAAVAGLLGGNLWSEQIALAGQPQQEALFEVPGLARLDGCLLVLLLVSPLAILVTVLLTAMAGVGEGVVSMLFYAALALALIVLWRIRGWLAWKCRAAIATATGLVTMLYGLLAGLPGLLVGPLLDGVVEPLLAAFWRRRRLLGDAMAVQLTRQPDAIASGLRRLGEHPGTMPATRWAVSMFVVVPRLATGVTGEAAAEVGLARARFHPPLALRLHKLVRMGADPALAFPQQSQAWGLWRRILGGMGRLLNALFHAVLFAFAAAVFCVLLAIVLFLFACWLGVASLLVSSLMP